MADLSRYGRPYTMPELRRAADLRRQGLEWQAITSRLRRSNREAVRIAVQRAGIDCRPPATAQQRRTLAVLPGTISDVAARLGVTHESARRRIHRLRDAGMIVQVGESPSIKGAPMRVWGAPNKLIR